MKATKQSKLTDTEKGELKDVLGERGEKIAYLALTDYAGGNKPLIRPAFLGQKWPTIDYYAELESDNERTPVALFQVKTTGKGVNKVKKSLPVHLKKEDAKRLSRLPLPAYVIGVCEGTRRVFVRSVSNGKGIAAIPEKYELTPTALKALHKEITTHWTKNKSQKSQSKFV